MLLVSLRPPPPLPPLPRCPCLLLWPGALILAEEAEQLPPKGKRRQQDHEREDVLPGPAAQGSDPPAAS